MPLSLKRPDLLVSRAFLAGEWRDADNGKTIAVTDPATGGTITSVPEMGAAETRRAIEAANAAWPDWAGRTGKERAAILRRWFDLMMVHRDDLGAIMTAEEGKPLQEAKGEVSYAAGFIEWFGEEAKRIYGDTIPAHQRGMHIVVIRQPVGVVAAITPWNFPAAMITRKAGAALASGCPIIVRPSSLTPLTALALAKLGEEAGIPKGVLSILTGKSREMGDEMTGNPLVRKITFTGSTAVGAALMAQAAPTVKKVSLELGGNAPFIVFDDADLNAAVEGAIACKFRNMGQTCVCANRIYVQAGIYEDFLGRFTEAVKALKVGNGFDEGVTQGPLINMSAVEKVEAHIADAVKRGAKVVLGGKRHKLGGTFFEPTVLRDVAADSQLTCEETFGPVAPLISFKNEEDAVRLANDTPFGLASYFYASDVHRIWRVAEGLEAGIVGINTGLISTEIAPFGGIKQSGLGREGSKYGIDEYTEIKYLCMGK
jgi:succinate-semialdehyde dehydrogenase/glutarate-semialdehyde dehydrogenase